MAKSATAARGSAHESGRTSHGLATSFSDRCIAAIRGAVTSGATTGSGSSLYAFGRLDSPVCQGRVPGEIRSNLRLGKSTPLVDVGPPLFHTLVVFPMMRCKVPSPGYAGSTLTGDSLIRPGQAWAQSIPRARPDSRPGANGRIGGQRVEAFASDYFGAHRARIPIAVGMASPVSSADRRAPDRQIELRLT